VKGDARALRPLGPAVRLVLLYGADTSASADLARTVAAQFADGATILAAATLTADPAALLAAASEIPMFGGARVIRVDDAGEDVLPAVAQLLDATVAGNPVVVIAGALKKGSKLVARVEAAANALAVVNYPPDAASTGRVIGEIAAEYGLRLSRDAVAALAQATGGERGIARQEVAKLALFVDATPAAPASAEIADVAAIGADFADADFGALVDGVAGGAPVVVGRQLAEFAGTVGGIALVRVVAKRFWLLLDLRAAVDGGASAATAVEAARPPVFYKERPRVIAQLARWRTPAIRAALARLLDAERAIKRSGSAGDVAVDQLLLALAVQAGR
jgi:DNA polymerase-3 subunit delta